MSDTPSEHPQPPQPTPSDQPPPALVEFMTESWARPAPAATATAGAARFHAARRERVAARFPGEWVVVPAGGLKVRSNDTDYRYRAGTDFAWLTGIHEPDAVLVMEPAGDSGHRATVFVREVPERGTREWFTDRRYSELWVGPTPGLRELAERHAVDTAPLDELLPTLKRAEGGVVRVRRGFDATVDGALAVSDGSEERDAELAKALSTMRLVKDDHEVACLQAAVDATVIAFEDVVRALPEARSERWVEGTFNRRARTEGHDVGYETIAAAGAHACTLHWVRNDGAVRPGELLLLDAGVEGPELYTADVTRTLPVSGRFTAAQREVYEVVWRAQQAGIAEVKAGNDFLAPHRAAMRVITEWLIERGILAASVNEAMDNERRLYQRWTLHGTSHMLGLDVHDCDAARREYREGTLEPGMVLTVEPGCYLRPDDLLVPEELRGIGVRIEDDVLVTEDGCRVLSAALPTEASAVEQWMASLLGT